MEELPQFAFLMNAFRCSANETSILGKKGRQPGASNRFVHFLLGGCDTRWSNLRSWLYFYFYNTAQVEEQIESAFNWLSYSVLPCCSLREWTSRLYELALNIHVALTDTRLRVAHTLVAWVFKPTKIKMQIIFNQTAHISLNHLENTAGGWFQWAPAPRYLSLRAEFCPVLCAVAHTYGF